MSSRTIQTLLSILVLIALVIQPVTAGAAPTASAAPARVPAVQPRQADPNQSAFLFRAVIEIASDTDLARLQKTGVLVLRTVTTEEARTTTVLADAEQLETLTRLGFRPQAADELRLLVDAQRPEKGWLAESLDPLLAQADAVAAQQSLAGVAGAAAPTAWQQALANGRVTCGFDTTPRHIFLPLILRAAQGSNTIIPPWDSTKEVLLPLALPPEPAAVASELDRTVPTDLYTAALFLYTGANPVQIEVAANAIDPQRVAVLRGQVRDRAGQPVSGALVAIAGHQEYGCTFSRADGGFDLVVNGGGQLTLGYKKDGYLPIQRHVQAPLRDYAWLPDGIMIMRDARVTPIDLTETTEIQVAQGSVVTDEDGTRQATLLFPPNTGAVMTLAFRDKTTVQAALSVLNVRATEYTIGGNGPKTMPGELPPQVGYTYALELGADEAEAAGALDVQFSQPVIFYVENFLGFPVGGIVPVGYYDRQQGQWIPSDNGRIVRVVSVTGGLADLDIDGDGAAEDAATLTGLGVTDAERGRLAGLYQPGQSVWRVSITHFTPWDCNWPYGPPSNAQAPGQPPPTSDAGVDTRDSNQCPGCTIDADNQALGESVDIAGTPFSLHYTSDRAMGRQQAYQLEVSLSGITVPTNLKRIDLEIAVAGRLVTETFPAAPSQSYLFTWDGRDAYGRLLQGAQPATVRLGYVYDAVYQEPAQFGQSFGAFSGVPITGSRARQEVTLWQEWQASIGVWEARGQGQGGWSLDVQHVYDPDGKVIYLGDGTRRSAAGMAIQGIETVAGTGEFGNSGDGGPATQAKLIPEGVAVGPDGSLYIAALSRVRRVDRAGIITTVAGGGNPTIGIGDGGPATQAKLAGAAHVALGSDGSLYISEFDGDRIRRVDPNRIITTVAGNGTRGYSGDGGPATQAQLDTPSGIAVGPDGSLYIADKWNQRIRRVGSDGIITTVAGNGVAGGSNCDSFLHDSCGDGGPAANAEVPMPSGVAVEPDGSLDIAAAYPSGIRHVGTDGIISSLSKLAAVYTLHGIALGPDRRLYVGYYWGGGGYVSRINEDGTRTVVTGSDDGCHGDEWSISQCGDGGPATQARFGAVRDVAVGPDGSLYIADQLNYRVRRVGQILPGFSAEQITIPSEDGSQLYVFAGSGRHLRTLHALTGATLYEFGYDGAGRLAQIEDVAGNITALERDANGNLTAIIGPYGQRTILSLDAHGYLAGITNPAGERVQFSYTPDGLMTGKTDPRGSIYQYAYDALGRFVREDAPGGAWQTLAQTPLSNGHVVTRTTALGRASSFRMTSLADDSRRHVVTQPDGAQETLLVGTDGRRVTRLPDGTTLNLLQGPDPRWGMRAPLAASLTITTPGGLTFGLATTRTVSLTDTAVPLSLAAMTDTIKVNGRPYTTLFTAASRTLTTTTPAGRTRVSTLNSRGQIAQTQIAGLAPVRYDYDARGRLSGVRQGSGAEARTVSLSYNGDGYPETITDPLGRVIGLAYDAAGRVTRQTLPDGRVINVAYDANNNVTSLTPPGKPAHTFQYTAADLLETYTPPAVGAGSNQTQYTYNLDRQLTRVTRPDGQTMNLSYDGAGRLTMKTLPRGSVSYAYNATTGNLQTVTAPDGGTLTYAYDGALLTGKTWAGPIAGSLSYTYDNDFRVASQRINGSHTITYQYDGDGLLVQAGGLTLNRHAANGLLTGSALGNVTDALTYNSFAELTGYDAAYAGEGLYTVRYTYDKLGRITAKIETVGGATTTYGYTYDLAGRLTHMQQNGATTASYTYDSNGNRLTGPGGPGAYDDQDRLTQYGATTYAYSANGELQSKTIGGQTTTYNYDVLGNLMGVTLPNGTQIAYVVDGQNRRVGKKVNDALVQGFLYQDGLNPIAQLDGSNAIVATFVYGSRSNVPDYLVKGDATYRIIADHLGSPRLVVNAATGAIAQRLDYDEFGNVVQDTKPGFQPFGFAGGIYDPHTRLTRFGVRDYDAETGRWTAKDPILFDGSDTNLYVYVNNTPINRKDPLGLKVSCQYDQATGEMACMDERSGEFLFTSGFSGKGVGRDNPSMQCEKNMGPVPGGEWEMEPMKKPIRKGPRNLFLRPDPGTHLCGRNPKGFLIHEGDPSVANASKGCVILSRDAIEWIYERGGGSLEVDSR